jgi:hypothetical protein
MTLQTQFCIPHERKIELAQYYLEYLAGPAYLRSPCYSWTYVAEDCFNGDVIISRPDVVLAVHVDALGASILDVGVTEDNMGITCKDLRGMLERMDKAQPWFDANLVGLLSDYYPKPGRHASWWGYGIQELARSLRIYTDSRTVYVHYGTPEADLPDLPDPTAALRYLREFFSVKSWPLLLGLCYLDNSSYRAYFQSMNSSATVSHTFEISKKGAYSVTM